MELWNKVLAAVREEWEKSRAKVFAQLASLAALAVTVVSGIVLAAFQVLVGTPTVVVPPPTVVIQQPADAPPPTVSLKAQD